MRFGTLEAGGTKMVLSVGNENNELLEQASIPTEAPEKTIPAMIDWFRDKSKAGFKPYDSLTYAKAATKKAASAGPELAVGDRVRHRKFGEGTVEAVGSGTVTVRFDQGETKKLATSVAPLEKI